MSTRRFLIRTLLESDVSERYLSWFAEPAVARFIHAAKEKQTLTKLKAFVAEKYESDRALLLGIFELKTGKHIGNIKFEPIDFERGVAVLGVMIGDAAWRGKGIFNEVFAATSEYLQAKMKISSFWLGVEKSNLAAIKSYVKAGFRETAPPAEIITNPRYDCLYMNFSL